MKIPPRVAAIVLALGSAACQPDPAPAPVAAARPAPAPQAATRGPAIEVPSADEAVRSGVSTPIELPPADTATAPLAENADLLYGCDDGSDLRVTFSGGRANITLPDASIATAPVSAAASAEAGGEVYVGERVGLRRIGAVVELQQDGVAPRRCREAGGNA
ncbi:MAG TPA: hypothetical protein VLK29_07255 [Luteimonas sp.]|nr:hypothetical protein [Luteimonas sp.]